MVTADTARRHHIRLGLGSVHNVATAAGLQRVRQRARRLVPHFADHLVGVWRPSAGSPDTSGGGAARLPAGDRTAVEDHGVDGAATRVHARRPDGCASMASLLPGSCAEVDRVARCQPGTPTGAWLAMNCSCSAAPTRSHSAVATSARNLSMG